MSRKLGLISTFCLVGASIALVPMLDARADVITDWNVRLETILIEKRIPPPPGARAMAMMHVAMFEAVNAIDRRYSPYSLKLTADRAASKEAAAATAGHDVLAVLYPDKLADLDAVLKAALAGVADEAAKAKGAEAGKQAAAGILALRTGDGIELLEDYRPVTAPGSYVPTVIPVSSTIGKVKSWVMTSGSQFRPAPPPALSSMTWTNDLNEVREYGGRANGKRTAEQTEIARFWYMTGPQAWNPIARQLADQKKLDITDNARFFALLGMATADTFIAVFDAKYHYNFWRPLTAVRNADKTENSATPREASWLPHGDTPMHPEYPCAHCISSGAATSVMQSFFGDSVPEVSMTSTTLPGVTRKWKSLNAYSDEVMAARIYGGFHYRFSGKVGQEMGRKIAELAMATQLRSPTAAPTR